jgi:DNA-3-methyladenine glycosylase
MPVLPREFYTRPDVVRISRELLGKVLVTRFDGKITSGIICETEAYEGVTDRASHAWGGRRTARTEIMYRNGGTAYVYLCYGIHSLFNIVTNVKDIPHAVLIRGIVPESGIPVMLERSGKKVFGKDSGTGPGKVSTLLGIHFSHTGMDLTRKIKEKTIDGIWVEDRGIDIAEKNIIVKTRVGVDYAGEDAKRPYRFVLVY